MTDKEVMQQALDALKNPSGNCKFTNAEYVARLAAITALKNAITQPVPPVGQKFKFTMDEWVAHARKHQWRFDEESVTAGVATIAQPVQPAYPQGLVIGPCICGSWPGGYCLHCKWLPDTEGDAA